MARMFPGSTVPGRRPKRNPQTVSGRPLWNTFARLDYIAATTELARGHKNGSVARPPRRLDPDNLCHRPDRSIETQHQRTMDRARVLSLRMDRMEGIHLDLCLAEWGRCIRELIDNRQDKHLRELRRLEAARGQVRVKNALRFANIHI